MSGSGGVYGGDVAKAPVDIRSLARSHTDLAINTLAGIARACKSPSARVNAAIALLDRGYGKPHADAEGAERITVTIRKILEGSAFTIIESEPKVIEHEATNGKGDDNDGSSDDR